LPDANEFNLMFILLNTSTILIFLMIIYLLKLRNKEQLHYAFLFTMISLFVWSIGYLIEVYVRIYTDRTIMLFVYVWYFGLCYTPVFLMITGIIYAKSKSYMRITKRFLLLFVIPTISLVLIITNDYHHLMFTSNFSVQAAKIEFGHLLLIHIIYSYTCIIVGLAYVISYSINNSGLLSKQSILVILGTVIPFVINILITFKLLNMPLYATAVSFSIAIILYGIAILRFNFLSISPIALNKVVDTISDGFIVVNQGMYVVDYNKTFYETFKLFFSNIKRNMSLVEMLDSNVIKNSRIMDIIKYINYSKRTGRPISLEDHVVFHYIEKYFEIEITPLTNNGIYYGTVVLFKDITQSKKDLETIQKNQEMLMQNEKLASLGQLIGGIAHNLKTPIMSISGVIEGLVGLVKEYKESIDDDQVTKEDHHEIADEMMEWINKIKPYCSYISDVITAVKGQAVTLSSSNAIRFTIEELLKKIEILMKHELLHAHCKLTKRVNVDLNTELSGDVNSLVQIVDNLIINSIHSYKGSSGEIVLEITQKNDTILIKVSDNGSGITTDIKNKLFKEMVTTKGKNGTGLGLYMSYSTIKGRFRGDMWFESESDKGTTFTIAIPLT